MQNNIFSLLFIYFEIYLLISVICLTIKVSVCLFNYLAFNARIYYISSFSRPKEKIISPSCNEYIKLKARNNVMILKLRIKFSFLGDQCKIIKGIEVVTKNDLKIFYSVKPYSFFFFLTLSSSSSQF